MIENRQIRIPRNKTGNGSLLELIETTLGPDALRWYVAQTTESEIVVEATLCTGRRSALAGETAGSFRPGKSVAVSLVPTGVGCAVGGYAGDAAPATRLLATTVDYLVTNPNAVNASNFISLADNVVYAEGFSIDLLCQGRAELRLPYANKVGLVIEATSAANLDAVFNLINTVRAVHGVDVAEYVITPGPIGSRSLENGSGAFVGTVDHPEVLFAACETLLARGVDAIALTTNIQDLPHDAYVAHFEGLYPNPLGGVEAVLSHLVLDRYGVPSAHAPMVNCKELALEHAIVDARGAGEMASWSGLACVLIGLHRAPQVRRRPGARIADAFNVDNLLAVVAPADCLGGIPVLAADRFGIPILAVEENRTVMQVDRHQLGLRHVLHVGSYAEAAGMLLALRHGIAPESLRRPLRTVRYAADELPQAAAEPELAASLV